MNTHTIPVDGMQCSGCATRVQTALESVRGVVDAAANHEANQVRVRYDPEVTSPSELLSTIDEAGYRPDP